MFDEEPKIAEYAVQERGSQLPLSQQEKALAELHDTISQLTARLKQVLTPEHPTDNVKDASEAREARSPLSDQLSANNMGIHKASRKLRGLMERLEC